MSLSVAAAKDMEQDVDEAYDVEKIGFEREEGFASIFSAALTTS